MADYVNIPMSVAADTAAMSATVAGNLIIGGEAPTLQSKTAHPSTSDQAIEPDEGYDALEDVTVKAVVIENLDAANIVSGVTVKIGDDTDDDSIASVTGTAQTGGSTLGTKTVNENGTYNASSDNLDGYSQVTVSVPASAVDTGTKSITANGSNQDVVGYASVDVNVPNTYSAGDEGKVVSSGALVAQTAHADVTPTTSDQTIDTTTNNSLKVKGDADLVAGNIKKGVEIFCVTGSYEGGGGSIPVETGTMTPSTNAESANFSISFEPVYFALFTTPSLVATDSTWRVCSSEMLIKDVFAAGQMARLNSGNVQVQNANVPTFSYSNGTLSVNFTGRTLKSGVTYTWYAIGSAS